jgi:hypothetical protein
VRRDVTSFDLLQYPREGGTIAKIRICRLDKKVEFRAVSWAKPGPGPQAPDRAQNVAPSLFLLSTRATAVGCDLLQVLPLSSRLFLPMRFESSTASVVHFRVPLSLLLLLFLVYSTLLILLSLIYVYFSHCDAHASECGRRYPATWRTPFALVHTWAPPMAHPTTELGCALR